MFANFLVIVIRILTYRPGPEPKLRKKPLPDCILAGAIFILIQGGSLILAQGVNFALAYGGNARWISQEWFKEKYKELQEKMKQYRGIRRFFFTYLIASLFFLYIFVLILVSQFQ